LHTVIGCSHFLELGFEQQQHLVLSFLGFDGGGVVVPSPFLVI
jgi:hypothetical protein